MSSGQPKVVGYLFVALAVLGAGAGVAYSWPWSADMKDQPSIRSQESPRKIPPHSIPREGKVLPMDRIEAGKKLNNPTKATADSLDRGKRLYQIYCVPCHGADAKGKGRVAAKFVPPPDLTLEVFRKRPDGFIYETIKSGGPLMPGQGEAVQSGERWDIVNYLRFLQQK